MRSTLRTGSGEPNPRDVPRVSVPERNEEQQHSRAPASWAPVSVSFVVVIAALNLVLDFEFIEKGAESGAPKYMEWYAGFGLLVTLVWLYIEIVRLLAKLRSRR